jgi:type IV pilus assembly protein PilO
MATAKLPKFDSAAIQAAMLSQFKGLNPNDPASWPILPRVVVCLALIAAIVAALWFAWLNGVDEELQKEEKTELTLKADYQKKLAQAVNLEALKKQREQVQQYVTQLEKQLPSKAEMDALLSDINQAGLGRSLNFELFRPGNVSVREYYAELPIAIKVTGHFHDIGAFASDVANLSRIVTLNNISIQPGGAKGTEGVLVMDATAKTFRYLDSDEVSAQRKAQGAKKK